MERKRPFYFLFQMDHDKSKVCFLVSNSWLLLPILSLASSSLLSFLTYFHACGNYGAWDGHHYCSLDTSSPCVESAPVFCSSIHSLYHSPSLSLFLLHLPRSLNVSQLIPLWTLIPPSLSRCSSAVLSVPPVLSLSFISRSSLPVESSHQACY